MLDNIKSFLQKEKNIFIVITFLTYLLPPLIVMIFTIFTDSYNNPSTESIMRINIFILAFIQGFFMNLFLASSFGMSIAVIASITGIIELFLIFAISGGFGGKIKEIFALTLLRSIILMFLTFITSIILGFIGKNIYNKPLSLDKYIPFSLFIFIIYITLYALVFL